MLMQIENQEKENAEQGDMRTKKDVVGYWYPKLEVDNADYIRNDDIMQEHTMIFTESENIRCEIKEGERQERYPSKI